MILLTVFVSVVLWAALALLAIILAGLVTFLIWRKPMTWLFVLLCAMPVQSMAMRVLAVDVGLSTTAVFVLSMWKEYVLVVLLIRASLNWRQFRFTILDVVLTMFVFINFIYIFVSSNFVMGVYGFRGNVEPLLFYLLARLAPLDTVDLAKLVRYLIILAAGISIFGVFQALVLQDPFLFKYKADALGLSTSHHALMAGRFIVRASSTFTSPNDMGMYITILLLVGLGIASGYRIKASTLFIVCAVLLAGMLFTLSRSSWLSFVIGFIVYVMLSLRLKKNLVLVIFFILLAITPIAIRVELPLRIAETLTLEDPSAAGRLPSILNGLSFIEESPFGIGLGESGPRASRFGNEIVVHSENYYILMAMDIGVIGLFVYLLALAAAIFVMLGNVGSDANDKALLGLRRGTSAALIGAALGVMVIPTLQELAVASLLWFFVGQSVAISACRLSTNNKVQAFDA